MLDAASSCHDDSLQRSILREGPAFSIAEALALAAAMPDRAAVPMLLEALASRLGASRATLAAEAAGGESPEWIVRRSDAGAWTAAVPILANGRHLGTVVVEGTGAPPGDDPGRPLPDARKLSLDFAVAVVIDDLRAENRRLTGSGPAAAALPPDALRSPPRSVIECPLAGEPLSETHASLFALFPDIVGRSAAIRGILHSILTAARSDIPVLIEGESGTGKELAARAIHRGSPRQPHPFLCENCGAFPANLAESEFFGHEKGAFTGADRAKAGLFERAAAGTVFLDEVGEMDLPLQRQLLRVLQEKEVRRIGGETMQPVDFRVISATNRVLEEMVEAGSFREDLYYRLAVATIHMPPLRERDGDIPILVEHFNRIFSADTRRPPLEFTRGALEALAEYRWPGNLRELRNEVWRLACGDRKRIEAHHLSRRVIKGGGAAARSQRSGRAPARTASSLRAIEREAIIEALRQADGNRAAAARHLGITRSALYRKMKRYGIEAR